MGAGTVPPWLERLERPVADGAPAGRVLALPGRQDVSAPIDEQRIVASYAR